MHEYIGQWSAAQQPDETIGKMGQVPLPKGKWELLIHANYARFARYPASGGALRSDRPSSLWYMPEESMVPLLLTKTDGVPSPVPPSF
jgi:hypothetical protein